LKTKPDKKKDEEVTSAEMLFHVGSRLQYFYLVRGGNIFFRNVFKQTIDYIHEYQDNSSCKGGQYFETDLPEFPSQIFLTVWIGNIR
jgi:hypothetical protein